MKLKFLSFFGVVLCISCQSEQFNFDEKPITESTAITEKVMLRIGVDKTPNNIFKVTNAELTNLISDGDKAKSRSGENTIYSVTPVVYQGDTIMYLCNSESCWTLYSVDKRMAAM